VFFYEIAFVLACEIANVDAPNNKTQATPNSISLTKGIGVYVNAAMP
jgi:hypothetical protein